MEIKSDNNNNIGSRFVILRVLGIIEITLIKFKYCNTMYSRNCETPWDLKDVAFV